MVVWLLVDVDCVALSAWLIVTDCRIDSLFALIYRVVSRRQSTKLHLMRLGNRSFGNADCCAPSNPVSLPLTRQEALQTQ